MESKKEMTNFKLNEELKKFYENYSLMMSEINKRFQELFKALEPLDKLTQSFKNISEKFNNYNLPKIDLSPLAKSLKVLNDYSKRVSYEEVKEMTYELTEKEAKLTRMLLIEELDQVNQLIEESDRKDKKN